MGKQDRRIIRLEACRGLAALIVVAYHLIGTFKPVFLDTASRSIFYVFINGTTAVVFFFVLSGFVLSIRFFENPIASHMAVAAFKRLPRLALLTTIITSGSAMLWIFGFYRFGDPARLLADFQPSIIGALKEGVWLTFLRGDSHYDSSLWTMAHEFRGSLLVFAMAPFLVFVLNRKLVLAALLFAIVIFHYADQYMIFFISGMAIAYYRAAICRVARAPLTIVLLGAGLYLLSYRVSEGKTPSTMLIFGWTAGASFLIAAVLQSKVAERLLDNKMGAALGALSFPIYLVHVPIIWSLGSYVYALGDHAIATAMLVSTVSTFLISWPLAAIDSAWVRFLNIQAGKIRNLIYV